MTKQASNLAPKLILSVVITVLATVMLLEQQGMIKHNEDKASYPVSTYRAVLLTEQDDNAYLLSRKPSNQHARCVEGYLFIQADANPAMKGLVVDYKNRGVKCSGDLTSTEIPMKNPAPGQQ